MGAVETLVTSLWITCVRSFLGRAEERGLWHGKGTLAFLVSLHLLCQLVDNTDWQQGSDSSPWFELDRCLPVCLHTKSQVLRAELLSLIPPTNGAETAKFREVRIWGQVTEWDNRESNLVTRQWIKAEKPSLGSTRSNWCVTLNTLV